MCAMVLIPPLISHQVALSVKITLLILGTTALSANNLSFSFFRRFRSETMFFDAADEAAPSGELES